MTSFIDTSLAALNEDMSAMAGFASDTRLYEFTLANSADLMPWLDNDGLLVAAFCSVDKLHQLPHTDILVISRRSDMPLDRLIGRQGQLHISQADGSRSHIHGLISRATSLGSDGGVARYQLRLVPWLGLLEFRRQSRVWQEQPVNAIIDSVLAAYAPHAHWQWSDDAINLLGQLSPRSYCIQYRETDFDFISRLLAEDGLSWRIAPDHPDAPDRHSLVLFADSTQPSACPFNPDNHTHGLAYTGSSSQQQHDSIIQLNQISHLQPHSISLASFDYKTKAIRSASVPSNLHYGSQQYAQLPPVEHHDHPGQYAFSDNSDAERHARLRMQAFEIRQHYWQGQSTVRSLRAGQRFNLDGNPRNCDASTQPANTLVTSSVTQLGINNLASTQGLHHAQALGHIAQWLSHTLTGHTDHSEPPQNPDAQPAATTAPDPLGSPPPYQSRLIRIASAMGYSNSFTAIPADRPWRPHTPHRLHNRPTEYGSQTARVVGFDNSDNPAQLGNDEICTDQLGRVRIRFHWQDPLDQTGNRASCWVRVAQRSAGGGMGSQFLPRIGQEVQVQFVEGNINRPVIIGAHYNGQGDAGIPATPGGTLRDSDTSALTQATDHSASAQGNLTNGHAPVWHGAGSTADTHNNAAAQWGIRSQEFAGSGYNQLVFDDSDQQGRIQLKTTQSGTELNLGHLIHSADNYRGSYRGQGIELRTDAWGSLRAGAGWLITSYGVSHSQSQRQPTADLPAGYGLLHTANTLGATLSKLADSHLSVGIAALKGSSKANASYLNDSAAPLPALGNVMQGMVNANQWDTAQNDAAAHNTQVDDQHLPHHTDPIISVIAKNDLSLTARQSMQFNAGETLNILNAADSQHTTGGVFRIHSGQAIGITAGGMKQNPTAGIQLITAQGDTTIQAHNDQISLKAKANLDIKSAQASIDFAAATVITLRTPGGASISIKGGNITVQCPGKILVQAGQKAFTGGTSVNYALPEMPVSVPVQHSLRWKAVSAIDGTVVSAIDVISISGDSNVIQTTQTGGDGRSPRELVPSWPEERMALIGSGEWGVELNSDLNPDQLERIEDDEINELSGGTLP